MPGAKSALLPCNIGQLALHTLGLSELVNFAADESHKQLLGESMVHGLACWLLSFLTVEHVADGCVPSLRW